MRTRTRSSLLATGALVLAVLAAGCGSSTDDKPLAADELRGSTIVVASHDSWAMSDDVMAKFTEQTGIKVKIATNGDAGALTNKLVLTKDDPIADGVYGIDNTFATRAIDEDVLTQYAPLVSPAAIAPFRLEGQTKSFLTPVDYSDVCFNVDDAWFAENKVTPPATLDDLVLPKYKGLTVVPGASTSSPGLAFLLATIGAYGEDGWKGYWQKLLDNEVKIDAGWSDAYEVDFSAGGGKGDRPIVLSYSSSPPFTIPEGGTKPTTSALLDTCFRQVEYAGVLKGAKNPIGMQKFIDFMIGDDFQAALPDNMFVYPVNTAIKLPAGWAEYAPTAKKPISVPAADITKNRTAWLRDWRDLTTR
ncbi:thiamine transport system substrate-binding protein [Marmoricola sp. OAE513]|uniref:thiamine ABC transporter substrate-binding protein n=1 Tax=Marmoricola sp. OAE513 TaxID=2817894 RepID=UPI001AE6E81E